MKPGHLFLAVGGIFLAYKAFSRKPSSSSSNSSGPIVIIPQEQPVQWNSMVEAQARLFAAQRYSEMSQEPNFQLSPGHMFRLTRDTVMHVWPNLNWPEKASQNAMVDLPDATSPAQKEMAWVVQAIQQGQPGHAMRIVWDKVLTQIVWPLFDYTPV